LEVKVKKYDVNAVVPTYAKEGDAGMDLTAVSKTVDEDGNTVYGTGLGFEIPYGYAGFLFPRSSNTKKNLLLGNSVGVVDSGYRGEVFLKFKPSGSSSLEFKEYEVGDRVAQIIIMPVPKVSFTLTDELSDSERGDTGFGSSGK